MDFPDRLRAALADRYEIERELGRGGMAVVYLARDVKHDRDVAIKVLRPEVSAALGADRFLREIQIAAKLQHPHILPLHDSGQADGLLYYVMPYVEGESLRQRLLREKQLPLNDALQIAREVADALSYAHSHDVVHRDIKPENVLLSGGHAMVADFGIARAISAAAGEPLTDSGVAIGTPAYMSPEQGTGETNLDGRTDIYALGCVLFEMLAGEPPFTGPTGQAIIARHVSERPPSLQVVRPSLTDELEQVVQTALAKVPADRFPTAQQFADALVSGTSLPTISGVSAHRVARRSLFARRPLYAAVAIVVGFGVLLAISLNRATTEPSPEVELDPYRIAVLYFDDRSEQQEFAYLAEAFTEDLIDVLSRVDALEVVPRSGVRAYRSGEDPTATIARDLDAGTLVDGSVSGSADDLRVTVRLIDAARDVQLESRTVVASLGEILLLRDAVADSVSRFLRERLGREIRVQARRAGTENVRAWEAVRRAERERKTYEDLRSAGDMRGASAALARGDSLLADAEALDRKWIEPIVLRGWLALNRVDLWAAEVAISDSSSAQRVVEGLERAIALAERALELRSDDPEALDLRGTARYRLWNPPVPWGAAQLPLLRDEAEQDLRAAVGAHPWPARALSTLSDLVRRKGDFEEARLLAEQAYQADHFGTEAREVAFRLAEALLDVEQYPTAMQVCDDGRLRFPDDRRFPACAITALASSETLEPDVAQARRLAGEMVDLSPPDVRGLNATSGQMRVAQVLARAGMADSASAVLENARTAPAMDDPRAAPLWSLLAAVWLELGEPEKALQALEVSLELGPQRKTYIRTDVAFRELWDDDRFQALVAPREMN